MSCFIRWSAPLAVLCLLVTHARGQEFAAETATKPAASGASISVSPARSLPLPAAANVHQPYRSPTYNQTAPPIGSPVPRSLPSRVRVLVTGDGTLVFLSQQEWLEAIEKIEKSGKLPDGAMLIESNRFLLEPILGLADTKKIPYEFAARGQATIRTNQFRGSAEQIGIDNDTISMSGKNYGVTLHTVNPHGQDMTLKAEYIQMSLTADSIQVERGTTIDANGARQQTAPQTEPPKYQASPFSTKKKKKQDGK